MVLREFWAQQCAAWVRAGDRSAYLYPIIAVFLMTAASAAAVKADILLYVSPYVALVAIMANRVCVRAGLLSALLSIPVYNGLFAGAPHFGFHAPSFGEIAAYVSMIFAALMVAPRRQPPERRIYDAGSSLPFTSNGRNENGDRGNGGLHGNGIRYWDVRHTGNWKEDCEVGTEYARIFIERARAGEPRPLIGWIVRDMIFRGVWSGVEAGFMQGVGRASYAAIVGQRQLGQTDVSEA